MKRIATLLTISLTVAYAVACIGSVYAGGSKILVGGALAGHGAVAQNGRMKFVKLASTDSTRVAIGVWGGAVTEAAAEDTTGWLDLAGLNGIEAGFTGQPFVQFQINHQIGAATDSVGYKLQYSADLNDQTTFSTGALTHVAANVGGSTFIDAMAPAIASSSVTAAGAQNARFIRLIILNDKIASGATRLYSVVPIVRGAF